MATGLGTGEAKQQLRDYVEYLRDVGIHDFYRQGEPVYAETAPEPVASLLATGTASTPEVASRARSLPVRSEASVGSAELQSAKRRPAFLETPIPKLVSFNDLTPLPVTRVNAAQKGDALAAIHNEIGDCTRCPLAYAGRRTVVFGDGDADARLMFVGEGPGADEDASGVPFVGKAGQLLNNMIQAMGLKRDEVYIANVVKCRPPGNRVPEPEEAETCDQFLLRQVDVIQPRVIVALGATAAMYLLGVKQSLSSLRGRWHGCRGAKLAVTYHPAYLLRDPRQKSEAWKDLQMVMGELGLKAPAKS